MQLPDAYYNSIQHKWDIKENMQWELGKELNAIITELPMERAQILKLTAKNTTANYDSLDDYERVYRYWCNEERYVLNWSQLRACISSDIKEQRELALLASEGMTAKQIYRYKTGKTWDDDVKKVRGLLVKITPPDKWQREYIGMAVDTLGDLLESSL